MIVEKKINVVAGMGSYSSETTLSSQTGTKPKSSNDLHKVNDDMISRDSWLYEEKDEEVITDTNMDTNNEEQTDFNTNEQNDVDLMSFDIRHNPRNSIQDIQSEKESNLSVPPTFSCVSQDSETYSSETETDSKYVELENSLQRLDGPYVQSDITSSNEQPQLSIDVPTDEHSSKPEQLKNKPVSRMELPFPPGVSKEELLKKYEEEREQDR